MQRRGSVFLFILAVLGVLFALAFGLLSSTSLASTSALESQPQSLADQAAEEGLAHAISLIHADFARSYVDSDSGQTKTIPTHFKDSWRTHFWPIDTYDDGSSNMAEYARGREMRPEDLYQNDVHVENYLTELYGKTRMFQSGYEKRMHHYDQSWTTHPGGGRWYEPGVRLVDTSTNEALDISFHLSFNSSEWAPHPIAANPSSADPAVYGGEPGDPQNPGVDEEGVFDPVRYDSDLRPIDNEDPERVRYRLRYAVAVEPVDGHLINSIPGEYATPGSLTSAAPVNIGAGSQGSPSLTDLDGANEVDTTRATPYVPAFTEMVKLAGDDAWTAHTAFRGYGHPAYEARHEDDTSILAGFSGSTVLQWDDSTVDGLWADTTGHEDDDRIMWQTLGPVPSYEAFNRRHWSNDAMSYRGNTLRSYFYQPFGMAPEAYSYNAVTKPQPVEWDEGFTDTPWRVNVSIMPARASALMLWAMLPEEFKTGLYEEYEYYPFTGTDADGDPEFDDDPIDYEDPGHIGPLSTGDWDIPTGSADEYQVIPHRDLFELCDSSADGLGLAFFEQRGGIDPNTPYPGTDPDSNKVMVNNWSSTEGDKIYIAESNKMSGAESHHLASDNKYVLEMFYSVFDDYTADFSGNGHPDYARYLNTAGDGDDLKDEYYYGESYWLDIAAAFTQALAITNYSWAGQVNGLDITSGSNLDSGEPCFTNMKSHIRAINGGSSSGQDRYWFTDQAPGAPRLVNNKARCYDVDGDGINDVPSMYDTVPEIDQQFLRNLGEMPRHYQTGLRPHSGQLDMDFDANYSGSMQSGTYKYPPVYTERMAGDVPRAEIEWLTDDATGGTGNQTEPIRELLRTGDLTTEQAALMELVVNDVRMSFFGASPQYIDWDPTSSTYGEYNFRPMDLDDDGFARCSCYPLGYKAVVSFTDERGRTVDGGPIPDPNAGDKIFSLTGYFVLQKSRYYRIFVRGELFDELRQVPVAQSNVETVYVVDPDGDMWDVQNKWPEDSSGNPIPRTTGLTDSHVLYQRKLQNVYRGTLSHAAR